MLIFLFYFKLVYSDCPDDSWIRRSGTGWCYKPFEGNEVSWNQAQSHGCPDRRIDCPPSVCKTFLVRIFGPNRTTLFKVVVISMVLI